MRHRRDGGGGRARASIDPAGLEEMPCAAMLAASDTVALSDKIDALLVVARLRSARTADDVLAVLDGVSV